MAYTMPDGAHPVFIHVKAANPACSRSEIGCGNAEHARYFKFHFAAQIIAVTTCAEPNGGKMFAPCNSSCIRRDSHGFDRYIIYPAQLSSAYKIKEHSG